MKRLLLSLALASGCIAGPAVVAPDAAPQASAAIVRYVYANGLRYTYIVEGGFWILVDVSPA